MALRPYGRTFVAVKDEFAIFRQFVPIRTNWVHQDASATTGRRESLRSRSGRAVVAAVQSRPRCSRADVARVTGLSTSAVSTLVADLIEAEVLVELDTKASGAGGRTAAALVWHPEQDRRSGSILATPT